MTSMTRTVFVCCWSLLLSACVLDCGESGDERSGLDQLPDRQSQWQGNQLLNYQINYEMLCFCSLELTEVTVTNGAISKVVVRDHDGAILREALESEFSQYYAIDGFFDLISLKDNSADKLRVEYDASLGYPTFIEVDPHAQRCDCGGSCSDVADDEYAYKISVSLIE